MNKMKVIILAAGKGERLGEVTRNIPKPMIRVKGKPILENNILLCKKSGFNEILINLYHRPEVITEYFKDGSDFGVKISYYLENKILGTAGAVVPMIQELGESPFFILYGDNFLEIDLKSVIEFHREKQSDFTIVTHKREDVTSSGVVVLDNEMAVTDFVEKPRSRIPDSNWVNAGIYLISSINIIKNIIEPNDDFGYDIIPLLLKNNHRLFGYKIKQQVWAIDTPEMLHKTVNEHQISKTYA